MSIEKIRQMRKERLTKVNPLKEKQEQIKNSPDFSDLYKHEQGQEIKEQLHDIDSYYQREIHGLIDSLEKDATSGFHNAAYLGLDEKTATVELLKEIRNQKQTEQLLIQYANNEESLLEKATQLIGVNAPESVAYIDALKSLGSWAGNELEKKYKEANLNDLQRAYKVELDTIKKQRSEFNFEVKGDPFIGGLGLKQ